MGDQSPPDGGGQYGRASQYTGGTFSMFQSYSSLVGPSPDDDSVAFATAPPAAWTGANGLPLADYYGNYPSGVGYSNAGDERPYSMQEEERTARGGLKRAWTSAEDWTLLQLVKENGAQSWATIADRLPGRVGKQCRER